ncbi:hypothetical protein H2508_08580 [Parahaliea sp. F7430]|uniref:Uncharacterized protein n=1 Tax=Sediminihaliea albiluteola TaxID=2758564 RepID=A0A7W2TWC0_9GAMM|nr:hypothetical protein [Sediminihaliea albiluteola]
MAGFAILTQPFEDQIDRCMTYQPSDRPLPAIIVGHPTQMVGDDVLRQRAEQIADAVQRLLNDEEPESPSK